MAFDIRSQGSCFLEILSEHNYNADEVMGDNDNGSLSSRLSYSYTNNSRNDMFTVEDTMDKLSDSLPGGINTDEMNEVNASRVNSSDVKGNVSENGTDIDKSHEEENSLVNAGTRDIGKTKPKRFDIKRKEECFDERSTASSDLPSGFPILDSNTLSEEIRRMYNEL